jgi:transcriptional regulator with XRE-family HTH domain
MVYYSREKILDLSVPLLQREEMATEKVSMLTLIREKLGLTFDQLAEMAGVSKVWVYNTEADCAQHATVGLLKRVARALNVPAQVLISSSARESFLFQRANGQKTGRDIQPKIKMIRIGQVDRTGRLAHANYCQPFPAERGGYHDLTPWESWLAWKGNIRIHRDKIRHPNLFEHVRLDKHCEEAAIHIISGCVGFIYEDPNGQYFSTQENIRCSLYLAFEGDTIYATRREAYGFYAPSSSDLVSTKWLESKQTDNLHQELSGFADIVIASTGLIHPVHNEK